MQQADRSEPADEVEGDKCYHELKEMAGGVEAVVLATRPETAPATMSEPTAGPSSMAAAR